MPDERAFSRYVFRTVAIGLLSFTLASCAFRSNVVEGPAAPNQPPSSVQDPVAAGTPPRIDNTDTGPPSDGGGVPAERLFRAAMDEKRSGSGKALAMLDTVRRRHPGTVWAARASFLLGMDALRDGGAGVDAAIGFMKEAAPLAVIEDYITFYTAMALGRGNRPASALAAYDSILTLFPDTALRPDILFQRSGALMDIGRFAEAKTGFLSFLSAYPRHALAPDALLGSATASMALGDMEGALRPLRGVFSSYPLHPASARAEGLLAMIRSAGIASAGPTPQDRYRRAEKLFEATRYREAISELAPLLKDKGAEHYGRAALKTVRSYMRLKLYPEAERALKGYLKAKDPEREAEALAALALVALRVGNEDLLVKTEKRLSARHPDSVQSAQVKIYLGRHFEAGDADRALGYYRAVLDRFKGSAYADDALWSSGWMEYRAGRFDDAGRTFSSYLTLHPEGGDGPRFIYWGARSAEKAGRAEDARAGYGRLVDEAEGLTGLGWTYYGYLAADRLGRMEKAEAPEPHGPEAGRDIVTPSVREGGPPAEDEGLITLEERYIEAVELLTLGLRERAAVELGALARRYSDDEDAISEIAGLYLRAGDYHRALRVYGERLAAFKRTPGGAGRDYSAVAFPEGIVELARKKAGGGSPDPYLVAAVMREESAFNPEVVSTAGAIGLMQVMPATGRLVAREMGKGPIGPSDLFDPELNVELGAWYLGHLSGRFNNDPVLTIAGYNAGPNAAARWAGTLPAEADEFIESIPYPETRRYVKKVLRSYLEFKRLYGGEDPPRALQLSVRKVKAEDGHRGTEGSGEGF